MLMSETDMKKIYQSHINKGNKKNVDFLYSTLINIFVIYFK